MSNTIEVMAQWLSGLWCWIYHVCLGFKSFEWQNILHLDCHGLDWIPFEILRSKNKGWIDPMGLTFPRMDQSNELQFLDTRRSLPSEQLSMSSQIEKVKWWFGDVLTNRIPRLFGACLTLQTSWYT